MDGKRSFLPGMEKLVRDKGLCGSVEETSIAELEDVMVHSGGELSRGGVVV